MLGAITGGVVWLLSFAVALLWTLSLTSPGGSVAVELLLTWSQPVVIALVVTTVKREGIPSGAGELGDAISWLRQPDADPDDPPVNPFLVALELAAVVLSGVGFLASVPFSLVVTALAFGAVGMARSDPLQVTYFGMQASDALALFLAGAVLWQVAWIVEGFEAT